MPKKNITRREALKLIGSSAVAALLSPTRTTLARLPLPPEPADNTTIKDAILTGRAIHTVSFYKEPTTSAEHLATRRRDEGFRILGLVRAPYSAHNDLWYRTDLGYAHSAWVLPIHIYPPQPFIQNVGEWGFWGQISQVYTEARVAPSLQAARKYRFYGDTVYHVVEAVKDEEGNGWYKVVDDYPPKTISYQWILARDVRRIPRAEMAPIHPFAGDKHIEVDLSNQVLTCYEGNTLVFTTQVASGAGSEHATPKGEKCVILKQASRHMSNVPYPGGPETPPDDIFDLPGIPWNLFFDLEGRAIHGTYWHNDFGIPRSHGCLNVPCEAARWLYRWVYPIGGFEDDFIQSNCQVGTPIHIF